MASNASALEPLGANLTLHHLFLFSAAGGGLLFVVQVVLSLAGAGAGDLGGGDAATGHSSPDVAFKLLSLQGLTAFFAMFGLVGLALYEESRVGATMSLLGALVGGGLTTFIIARIFQAARKLEASGNVDLRAAVDMTGTVYLRIAPGKPGKVTLTLNNRLLQLDAISATDALETGSLVRVVDVLSDGTVRVVKV